MTTAGPVAERLVRLIRQTGPIPLQAYMAEANAHYYASRDPLGAAGDFITAPEISQMFGELVGLALADAWDRAGRPADPLYVELGPGRGTLAADALRAMRAAGLTPQVWLVEGSPALRAEQAKRVPESRFADDLTQIPESAPLLVVANEFLDALPIRQSVLTKAGWRERCVAFSDGNFTPVAGSRPLDAALASNSIGADEGSIVETCPAALAIVGDLCSELSRRGGVGLLIDYGHANFTIGSSFQAVRGHERVDPFVDPGEADLTALVQFEPLMDAASAKGCLAGLTTQGAFLRTLGIADREQALARAHPLRADEFAGQVRRLIGDEEMGALFKVMGLAGDGWPLPAGI